MDSNKKKQIWLIIIVVLFVCQIGLYQAALFVNAEEKTEQSVQKNAETYRNGVVHIESKCWDGDSQVYRNRAFSGFVVSADSTGIYIVTVYDKLTYTSEEKEKIKTEYELEQNSTISEQIEVIFGGDLRVQASIVGESEQRNLTVLKLEQNINFDSVLLFAEEYDLNTSQILLLSYPAFEDSKKAVYNEENVEITEGTATGYYKKDEIIFFKHDIQADSSSIGGPLLNEEGAVVGVFQNPQGKQSGKAISGEAVKTFLSTFNISYAEYEPAEPEKRYSSLHILLGAVILGLFFAVFWQAKKGSKNPKPKKNEDMDKYSSRTVKEDTAHIDKKTKLKIDARLEYPAEKRRVTMQKALFIIGRAKEADFILAESNGISRKHACIQYDGAHFYLTDLKSTNHTFLNGSELKPGEKRMLKDGDEIMIAKERLIFRKGA